MNPKKTSADLSKVAELLQKIIDGATSNEVALSEVLRLCLRLGNHLKNEDLVKWVRAELNGYESREDLPDYRVMPTQVLGHFSGSFGSGLKNAPIPKSAIDEDHCDWLFTNHLTDPAAELEQLTQGDKAENLKSPWPADIVAYYQRKQIYEHMVLSYAWRILTKATLSGILDTIRTRILEFALQIEEQMDIKESKKPTGKPKLTSPSEKKVSQIVNNTIYGGNVAFGNVGDTNQYNVQIKAGDLPGLKEHLKSIGVTNDLLNSLDEAIKEDEGTEKAPGSATSGWLAKVMSMIGRGTLSLATNAGGSMIATALMQYLGQ